MAVMCEITCAWLFDGTGLRAPKRRQRNGRQRDEFRRGDDTVGNPYRAQIAQLKLFEFIPLLKLDKHLPVDQFEATVSQTTVPSPPLNNGGVRLMHSCCLMVRDYVRRNGSEY